MAKLPWIRGVVVLVLTLALSGSSAMASETTDAIAAGNSAVERNELDAAVASYSTAIRLSPSDPIGYASRARAYNLKGNWTAAVADCDAALRLQANLPGAYLVRALAQTNLKKPDNALADVTAAVRLEPTYADAYCLRGEILEQQGRLDAALGDYAQCLQNDPKNFYPHFCRAGIYEKQGESTKALEEMTEAVRLNPESDMTQNGLAWELATSAEPKLRNGARALQYAWKACDLTKWKSPACLDTLAAAYAEIGDFDEAVKWQQKAVALAPTGEDATELRDHLKLYQAGKPYHAPLKPVEKPAVLPVAG